jgi:hypothetical protein
MLTRMGDPPNSDSRRPTSADGSGSDPDGTGDTSPGVLASLPRTRPQRASARRVAARATGSRDAGSRKAPRPPAASRAAGTRDTSAAGDTMGLRKARARPAGRPKPASDRWRAGEPAPRQGYEAEPDSLGGPVQPPGGAELVASAAELAGELAKSGVTAGARVLRDFLSRLPG